MDWPNFERLHENCAGLPSIISLSIGGMASSRSCTRVSLFHLKIATSSINRGGPFVDLSWGGRSCGIIFPSVSILHQYP